MVTCHLCQRQQPPAAVEPGIDGLWFCRDHVYCNYHTRRRLRMPLKEVRALLRAELTQAGRRPGVIPANPTLHWPPR
jgi:hypothetical protein